MPQAPPKGHAVQQLKVLLRTAICNPANALLERLLQEAVDRIDVVYHPKPGQVRKGRGALVVQGIFGSMSLQRDYYYHPGKAEGPLPRRFRLGLGFVAVWLCVSLFWDVNDWGRTPRRGGGSEWWWRVGGRA